MTSLPSELAASRVLNETRFDRPSFSGHGTNYVICSTPRSGSTLLAFALLGSNSMGVPHEYLHSTVHMPALAKRFGLDTVNGRINIENYFDQIRKLRTTANGVFGLKTHYHQLTPFIDLPSIARLVETAHLIWIRRRDLVGQAISYYVATTTQRWSTFDEKEAGQETEPAYNGPAIAKYMKEILAENACWREMFAAKKRPPFDVWYEDLVVQPDAICQSVCKHVGVVSNFAFDLAQTGLQRVTNARAQEWSLRFRSEYAVNRITEEPV